MGERKQRSWFVALFLHIGIRIRYFFESWFFLKPLFSPLTKYPSLWRPKDCPEYDFITQTGFIFIWLITAVARDYKIPYLIMAKTGILRLLAVIHRLLSNRLIKKFKKSGYNAAQREMPIPEYDWQNGTPNDFYHKFVNRPHPVILRNFMKDKPLLKELSWDEVFRKYGEEDVVLTVRALDGVHGKLKEVNNPRYYLHNSEILFDKYPEIKELFESDRLEPYMRKNVGYEQLFIGREGTGTPFHHAANFNFFYNIHGKKRWYFVDPYDTFLMYPTMVLGRAANMSLCLYPDEYNKNAFPLFEYCPVYTAELNPGDVLFNPPWWWHAIRNVTETTVAVATRWHTGGIAGHNLLMTEENYDVYRIGSLFFLLGLNSLPFLQGILQTPSPRKNQESMTIRETKNRFTHDQRNYAEAGGVTNLGVIVPF